MNSMIAHVNFYNSKQYYALLMGKYTCGKNTPYLESYQIHDGVSFWYKEVWKGDRKFLLGKELRSQFHL